MKQRMVEEVAGLAAEKRSRRRYHRLSQLGRGVLSQEIAPLEDVASLARQWLLRPEFRPESMPVAAAAATAAPLFPRRRSRSMRHHHE
jgi:type II secretory pathway component PulJ